MKVMYGREEGSESRAGKDTQGNEVTGIEPNLRTLARALPLCGKFALA